MSLTSLVLGFYYLPSASNKTLVLGPFQGKVACQSIEIGRGVCGTAASTLQTQLVLDVHTFPGHIACDDNSNSEIVVPILAPISPEDGSSASQAVEGRRDRLVGVIDIDCAELKGFDELDKAFLEKLARILGESCDWPV
jgi:L-methionine (R)-S-oxide reductase